MAVYLRTDPMTVMAWPGDIFDAMATAVRDELDPEAAMFRNMIAEVEALQAQQ